MGYGILGTRYKAVGIERYVLGSGNWALGIGHYSLGNWAYGHFALGWMLGMWTLFIRHLASGVVNRASCIWHLGIGCWAVGNRQQNALGITY